jgi:protein phosphatase
MTRYVGQAELQPEVRRWRWTGPARLLLCSDGVNKELTDAEIEGLLPAGTPEDACERLVAAARAAGGRDNISVIVVDGP